MLNTPKRLGEALMEEGILNQNQLDEALIIQKDQPYRSFGDIVSLSCQIPRETIENVFVKRSLIPAIITLLTNHLSKEEHKFSSSIPLKADQLQFEIEINSIRLKRTVSKSFVKNSQGNFTFNPEVTETATDIDGSLTILIKTLNHDIVYRENGLHFTYEFEKRNAELLGHFMDSLKFHFSRKNKEIMGVNLGFNPITEKELHDVLSQL